jgi:membrane-bound ClpP family serine protease
MFYWALLLLVIGLFVVVLELFVPSAGILGFVAGGLILAAIIVGFIDSLQTGALILFLTVVSLPLLFYGMVKVWPHTPLGRRILLKDIKSEDVLPNSSHYKRKSDLEGQLGIAKTKMLPSGTVLINGEKYDAISDGFAVEAGDPIKVVDVRENRIYVQPYDGSVDDAENLPARDVDILSRPIEELGLDPIDDPLN